MINQWNKENLTRLLEENDNAVIRALLVLFARQTAAEQSTETTHVHNNRGFTGADAGIASSMVKFYNRNGYLTPKQINVWRKRNKNGQMKIAKYWRQLLEEIEAKQGSGNE